MMTKLRINVLAFLHSTETLDALKVVLKETALLAADSSSICPNVVVVCRLSFVVNKLKNAC